MERIAKDTEEYRGVGCSCSYYYVTDLINYLRILETTNNVSRKLKNNWNNKRIFFSEIQIGSGSCEIINTKAFILISVDFVQQPRNRLSCQTRTDPNSGLTMP